MVHRTLAATMYLGSGAAWMVLLGRFVLRPVLPAILVLVAASAGAALAFADMQLRERLVPAAAAVQGAIFAFNGGIVLFWLAWQLIRSMRRHGADVSGATPPPPQSDNRLRFGVQLAVWTLGFWYLGTLNGPFVAPRALLPCILALALAILTLARAQELNRTLLRVGVAITLAAGLLVGAGDYLWAETYRDYASKLAETYRTDHSTAYFLGHWGWQHYAASAGLVQFDPARHRLSPGDLVIWPRHVDCPLPVSYVLRGCREIARETVPANWWLPRTRSPEGLIFLHGDTAGGRIPWGWTFRESPLEVFVVYQALL
jgi:hypothetical protein